MIYCRGMVETITDGLVEKIKRIDGLYDQPGLPGSPASWEIVSQKVSAFNACCRNPEVDPDGELRRRLLNIIAQFDDTKGSFPDGFDPKMK
jgi:hypothetical protein